MHILRGDHCTVVRLDDDGGIPVVADSGATVPEVSVTLMEQAIADLAPVVSSARSDTDTTDGMLLADLRSILCAPIVWTGGWSPASTSPTTR